MQTNLQDRMDIADLITGWIHRDLAQWDDLRTLFHPDGEIEVTWFEGKASDFVDASMRMGASDLRTKHLITSPVVAFNGCKAVVETNVVIIGENLKLGLGCAGHSRFYDLVEKRWRRLENSQASMHLRHGIVHISDRDCRHRQGNHCPLSQRLCTACLSAGKKRLSGAPRLCDEG